MNVLEGLLAGRLDIGRRTPVDAPGWATLEVYYGGFATGKLHASGSLHELERELMLQLDYQDEPTARAALNAHYLNPAGMADLAALLRSGCYRIEVPEEGALLAVAWLRAFCKGVSARADSRALSSTLV